MNWPGVIETINRSCIVMFNDSLVCTLCSAKLPGLSQFNSHTRGITHRENIREQLEQMVENVFSIGICFEDEKLYCNLCDCNLMWLRRESHIESNNHCLKVQHQIKYGHWFKNKNKVVETINKVCILVINENRCCILCKHYPQLPAWAQYHSHTNATCHKSNLKEQLVKATSNMFSLGIILDGGGLYCALCDVNVPFSEQLNHR